MVFRKLILFAACLSAIPIVAGCSRELTPNEARRSADEYVRTQFNVKDFRPLNVTTAEEPEGYVVTYSAKGEALGGPLVIGVNKKTGLAHLIEGYQ